MKRRFWGLLLVVVLMVTSLDMTVFAIETESKEDVQVQKDEIEQKNEAEQIESEEIAEAVKQTDDAGEIEELDAIVETQDSEYISDNSNQMTTEVYEKSVEGKEMQEIILLQEPTGNRESSYDVTVEEKQEQMSNTGEETGSSIGDKGNEEMQSEKTEIDADVAASYERISRVSRDDGIWLFPLGKSYWNRFTDWAGCPGYSKCSFCGKVHNSWGDSAHTGQSYGHNGFDIGASIGTPVLAAASGTVAHTSIGNNGGRGNFVVIEHSISGTSFSYYSYYQHLNSISVSIGASVKAGDTIAKSGNSGIGTGAHLHFGIVMAQKGINIGSKLGSIENKGWVTSGENKEGRILVGSVK
ncbi:peptidoglycan DD-metalloendopeptidase family protein [Lachnospiraceae bacterium MD335]|nr:peptidoglycan DD-metalloendopeptidase family protein [Lachnospiraceae bacterium MD335]